MSRKYDLEKRLIAFAIRMMEIAEQLPKTKAGNHVAGQLVRCGTSPAFNYGVKYKERNLPRTLFIR